jgi:hypothetical protein
LKIDNFSSVRDLMYLAGLLAGLALGFFFSFSKKLPRRRQKDSHVTLGIFILSAALIAASASLVLSKGMVIYDGSLLRAACFTLAIGLLAALLPEIFLFPIVIIGGVCVVLTAYLFLRHPQPGGVIVVAKVIPDSSGALFIEPEYPKTTLTGHNLTVNSANSRTISITGQPFTLEYKAALVTLNRLIPLVGGQQRYIPAVLNLVDSNFMRIRLYRQTFLEEAFTNLLFWYTGPLVDTRHLFAQTELTEMAADTKHILYFDGIALYKKTS